MYFHRVFRVAIALFLVGATAVAQVGCSSNCDLSIPNGQPGGCADNSKEPGTEGGPCDEGFGSTGLCGEGLRCWDGACVECGGGNDICCDTNAGDTPCSPGLACDPSTDAYDTCVADCGLLGMTCCGDEKDTCTEGLCSPNSDTCEPVQNTPYDCIGTESHFFHVKDGGGCDALKVEFTADSAAEAQACADAFLAMYNTDGTWELAPLDDKPDCEDVCEEWFPGPGDQLQEKCFFDGKAACEAWSCANNSCEWTDPSTCNFP